ncbi:MAG: hypothetical protein PHV37_07450 [Candidatus Gastranaerophilales bacterium]|nr:hypothetical protein [Candidatus Gastranaerophilales bacterium]
MDIKEKDPAFLFYSSDFLTGCAGLTMEERGQYITMMCLQHQQGHLSDKTIRLSVGNLSDDILSKFLKDKNGHFYNKRLDDVIEKRKAFTESRRENGKKGGRPKKNDEKASAKPSANLLGNGNENETITEDKIEAFKKLYNETCSNLPEVTEITETRLNKIIQRLKEKDNLEYWKKVFEKANRSDFFIKKSWCSFDWFIENDTNYVRVYEGTFVNMPDVRLGSCSTFRKEANRNPNKYSCDNLEHLQEKGMAIL